jgi:cardiolipin hydrolase
MRTRPLSRDERVPHLVLGRARHQDGAERALAAAGGLSWGRGALPVRVEALHAGAMRWFERILRWLWRPSGLVSAERGSTPLVAETSAGEPPAGVREAEGRAARAEERAAQAEARAQEAAARATRAEERLGHVEAKSREAEQQAERLRVRCEEAERRLAEAETARAGKGADRAPDAGLAEVWWSPGDECLAAITRQIERAQRTIEVCVFTVTDDRIANALLAAHRRSVKVRLVTDNDKSSDLGSDVARLGRAGIAVRVDRTEYHMHHKFAVFDGVRALTGSYNWTRGAARDNEEHIVVTDDARIVGALSRGFEELWRKFA